MLKIPLSDQFHLCRTRYIPSLRDPLKTSIKKSPVGRTVDTSSSIERLAESPHQHQPPSQEHPASTSLHRPTNRARANSIAPTIIHPERVFTIASDDTVNASVRTSRTRIRAVGGDDLSQAAVGGDFEGLEAGHPGGAGVVPDVDVGLRVARAVGAAVEGHYCGVGCEG